MKDLATVYFASLMFHIVLGVACIVFGMAVGWKLNEARYRRIGGKNWNAPRQEWVDLFGEEAVAELEKSKATRRG